MFGVEQSNRGVSKNSRIAIGITCILTFFLLGYFSFFSDEDPIVEFWFYIGGVPLFLVGVSLLFGKASTGKGIFSAITLYFMGTVLAIAIIFGVISGQPKSLYLLLFVYALFSLAKSRKRN